jgi:F-type H+-transporting ATPase subunit delta
MATITNNDIARSIYLGAKEKSSHELSLYFKNVVQFLSRRHLLSKTGDILEKLQKIINQEENKIIVKISSAEKLGEKTKEQLISNLKKRYAVKEVILVENLDKRLLGGMRLEINDEVIDLSIKNQLKKLQEYLIREKP